MLHLLINNLSLIKKILPRNSYIFSKGDKADVCHGRGIRAMSRLNKKIIGLTLFIVAIIVHGVFWIYVTADSGWQMDHSSSVFVPFGIFFAICISIVLHRKNLFDTVGKKVAVIASFLTSIGFVIYELTVPFYENVHVAAVILSPLTCVPLMVIDILSSNKNDK